MSNDNPDRANVTLTPRELEAMDAEINREIQRLGLPPTVENLRREGYTESDWLNRTLDAISGVGRVVTLLVAEIIQSGAALIIGVFFAILEYWRVHDGALALGQKEDQARLIGMAIVAANVVVPIMMLRQLRGQKVIKIRHRTLRGYLEDVTNRLMGKTWVEDADVYYNPTLGLATHVITYLTIIVAVYDLLHPLIQGIFEGTYTKPPAVVILELIIGLGFSIVGVFFLQSAAHAIGARTLTDNPRRLTDMLDARRADYEARVDTIRRETQARHLDAKVARLESRTRDNQEPRATRQLAAGSQAAPTRNRDARSQLADWFSRQPEEVLEAALAGERSLRQIARESGVDKEVVRRYLVAHKATIGATRGDGSGS